jgi:hypothetical protein
MSLNTLQKDSYELNDAEIGWQMFYFSLGNTLQATYESGEFPYNCPKNFMEPEVNILNNDGKTLGVLIVLNNTSP